jgi:HPt (histidine-containing phosphotransfer) domain-containing protein
MSTLSDSQNFEFLSIDSALEQIGDAPTMLGMLTMLEESLGRDIPAIGQLLVQGEVRAANRLLHTLKGLVPIFCVPAFCQHVTRVEELSKTGAVAEVSAAYFALMPELEQLQSEVTLYLTDSGGAY